MQPIDMPQRRLPSGEHIPALGIGTWHMGESERNRSAEIDIVKAAIDHGVRLIDTAEMYGDGGAEEVVGQAIGNQRDQLFVVSKIYPHHASRRGTRAACEASLRRLKTDRLDLYLLHWPGSIALAETVDALEDLKARQLIRHWGVSNFDLDDMAALWRVAARGAKAGGNGCAVNQVYYSASKRGVEFDLIPWQHERDIPLMAYCPLDQGALTRHPELAAIGQRHDASAAQIALAWLLARPQVVVIPKAARSAHLSENLAALRVRLTTRDIAEIDRIFPRPDCKKPLAIV